MSMKLKAGQAMPEITLPAAGGGDVRIGGTDARWRIVVVYRGLHCPICKSYLGKFEAMKDTFDELGADIVAVSGDAQDRAESFKQEASLSIPVGYDMSEAQMRALGLYVSEPLSHETDRRFPEPGLFLVNPGGQAHIVDIANAPFMRPDPALIVRGLKAIHERNYPIRGTAE